MSDDTSTRESEQALSQTLREAQSEAATLRSSLRFYLEREAFFAKALGVCDNGQYRNDWPAAMDRIIRERDALRAAVADHEAADRRLLADLHAAEARAVAAEASVEALRPIAVFHAIRTGHFVDEGCSRDTSRWDVRSGHPLPPCDICGASEDADCQAGLR